MHPPFWAEKGRLSFAEVGVVEAQGRGIASAGEGLLISLCLRWEAMCVGASALGLGRPGCGARWEGQEPRQLPGGFPFLPDIGLARLALAQEDGQQGLEACPVFPPSVPSASLLPSVPPSSPKYSCPL